MLSGKYLLTMDARTIAKLLGRRGGKARAKRLSDADRKRIAAMGGRARGISVQAERRILQTLAYAASAKLLQGGSPAVRRLKRCHRPLPRLAKG
jgi:hypothetical protein